MIDAAIDISLQIGWDTVTDLDLAHRFIEEKGLAHEFVGFLLGIKKHDEEQMEEEDAKDDAKESFLYQETKGECMYVVIVKFRYEPREQVVYGPFTKEADAKEWATFSHPDEEWEVEQVDHARPIVRSKQFEHEQDCC
jgi:hypothetical protein